MINIAVVGCGYWGPNLIRNFETLEESRVKMVCDLDAGRLVNMKRLYPNAETTSDFEQVLNDDQIKAVVIALPTKFHYEAGKRCLLAGKHAFIEKPLASSVDQCEELVSLAKRQNLTLMVGHTFIYSSPVRKIKEIIDSGELGELQYINSRRLNLGLFQKDINVTWDLAPHDLSIILYILNELPRRVGCHGKAHVTPGIEDVTHMSLNFSNGGFALVHNSWLDPNKVREMTFVGTKKMLVYDDIEPMEKIKIFDKRVQKPPHYETFGEFQYSYHYGDMYIPHLKQVEPLKVECQHFLDCIKTGAKSESCGLEGTKVIRVLEAASKSLSDGGGEVDVL
ncbi:MAG: Gfo/Idh/MocA family oxidoreductase [Phycisphaerae bacterium]|nr:Gfo/Idh/MocA family oxidoreductase [Phycisphaerae bacterium]